MIKREWTLGVLLAACAVLAGCSASFSIGGQSVEDAAVELISGELADELGLGELSATCPPVEDPEVGTEFTCTATTSDGRTIEFDGVVDREDHIDVQTTNIILPDKLEANFYDALSAQNPDVELAVEGFDCGEETIVLEADDPSSRQVTCEVTPTGQPTQTATLTVNDLATSDIDYVFDEPVGGPTDEAADTAGQDDVDEDPAYDPELLAVAESALLTVEDFGPDWGESPRTPSDVDYAAIDGCQVVDDLINNDGHLAEAESNEFASGDITVDHSVRIYPDTQTAIDVMVAWSEQVVLNCIVAGAEEAAGEAFDAGELDPFEEVAFNLQAFEQFDTEPRFTNLELTNTLLAPDDVQLVIINNQYFIQVGNMLSQVGVLSPNTSWEETTTVLDLAVAKMAEAQS